MYEQLGTAAGGGYGALLGHTGRSQGASALLDLLKPLDYPRQALWNLVRGGSRALSGEGTWQDALGALPGLAGVAGAAMGPLGMLGGALAGGLAQGVGQATGSSAFEASRPEDVTGSDAWLPNALLGAATDPLTYAGMGLGRNAGRGMADMEARTRMLTGGSEEALDRAAVDAGRHSGRGPRSTPSPSQAAEAEAAAAPTVRPPPVAAAEVEAAAAPTVRPAQPPEPFNPASSGDLDLSEAADIGAGGHDPFAAPPEPQAAPHIPGRPPEPPAPLDPDAELEALNAMSRASPLQVPGGVKPYVPKYQLYGEPARWSAVKEFEDMMREYGQTGASPEFLQRNAPLIEHFRQNPEALRKLENQHSLGWYTDSGMRKGLPQNMGQSQEYGMNTVEKRLNMDQAFQDIFGRPSQSSLWHQEAQTGMDRYGEFLRTILESGSHYPGAPSLDPGVFTPRGNLGRLTPHSERASALLEALGQRRAQLGGP